MGPRAVPVLSFFLAFGVVLGRTEAAPSGLPARAKLPEPIVGESITDIDGEEAGELETDLTLGLLFPVRGGPARGRPREWASSVEAEWRANEKLGLSVDLGLAGVFGPGPDDPTLRVAGVRFGLSWALVTSFRHEFFLQAQLSLRPFAGLFPEVGLELGEPALPYALRVQGAWRRGPFNLRATLGGSYGPASDDRGAPILASLAALFEFGKRVGDGRRGVLALEADYDGARRAPLCLIPEAILALNPFDTLIQVEAGVPLLVESTSGMLSAGGLLRLTVEFDRD